jgi:putative Ig domain-containing protein
VADFTVVGTKQSTDSDIQAFFDTTTKPWNIVKPGDRLRFLTSDATLVCSDKKNLEIRGTLEMKPGSASVDSVIHFDNIDSFTFAGSNRRACSAATASGSTVTYTIAPLPGRTDHYMQIGDKFKCEHFQLEGEAPSKWGGTYVITARTPTTVSCTSAAPPPTGSQPTRFGTVRGAGVMKNDTGVFFTGAGKADCVGTTRRAWSRLAVDGLQGQSTITLQDTPTGWLAGDTVVLCATGINQFYKSSTDYFAEMTIAPGGVSGNTVTFTTSLPRDYKRVTLLAGLTFGPEVMNITRNVRFEGVDTTSGKLHVMVTEGTSVIVQNFQNVVFRHCGPSSPDIGGGTIVGRWATHFHMNLLNSVGSLMENCVVWGSDTHAYVPHGSDGITYRNCLAYDVAGSAFWWDMEIITDFPDFITYDRCGVARQRGSAQSVRIGAFTLALSKSNLTCIVRDCFATGVDTIGALTSGFDWPEPGGLDTEEDTPTEKAHMFGWKWEGQNVSHNNNFGHVSWMNTDVTTSHPTPGALTYRNATGGLMYGAYSTSQRYENFVSFEDGSGSVASVLKCGLLIFGQNKVGADGKKGIHQYGYVDLNGLQQAIRIREAPAGAETRIVNCDFKNSLVPHFQVAMSNPASPSPYKKMDLIRCSIHEPGEAPRDWTPDDFLIQTVLGINPSRGRNQASWIRVQSRDDQTAFKWNFPQDFQAPAPGVHPSQVTGATFAVIPPFALRVTTQSLVAATQGVAYSQQLQAASEDTSPRTWRLFPGTYSRPASGPLPAGLTLSATGVISGSPSGAPGTYPIIAEVQDAFGMSAPKPLSVVVTSSSPVPLDITTPTPLPQGSVGDAYSLLMTATGGSGTGYVFSITGGDLPPGLNLASNGQISGAPTSVVSAAPVTIRVRDSLNTPFAKAFTMTTVDLRPSITNVALDPAEVGVGYSDQLMGQGGTGPYTFANILGPLPTGMSLSTSGALTGTPTTAGTYPVRFRITDSTGRNTIHDYVIAVAARVDLVVPPIPTGAVGQSYFVDFGGTGGIQPYEFRLQTDHILPPGLVLSSTSGEISGLPATEGTFPFRMILQDGLGVDDFADIIINIEEAIIPPDTTQAGTRAFRLRGAHGRSKMRSRP